MCISAWPATFTNTITGTWEVVVEGVLHHVIWYQNRVQSKLGDHILFEMIVQQVLSGTPAPTLYYMLEKGGIKAEEVIAEVDRRRSGQPARTLNELRSVSPGHGNCLIIPLMGSWESIKLLNTHDTPNLLRDIDAALTPRAAAIPQVAAGGYGSAPGRMVFLQFDIYDIVIAENAGDIAAVVSQIKPEKRPEVNPTVFQRMQEWYNCPVALCCFNTAESGEAKPLGFAFEPTNPEKLVVYTMDGHDGRAPNPNAMVQLDHTIFVGSYLTRPDKASAVTYRDAIPDHLRPYMLSNVLGRELGVVMLNGDIEFDVADVRAGRLHGLRKLPLGAGFQHANPPVIEPHVVPSYPWTKPQ